MEEQAYEMSRKMDSSWFANFKRRQQMINEY